MAGRIPAAHVDYMVILLYQGRLPDLEGCTLVVRQHLRFGEIGNGLLKVMRCCYLRLVSKGSEKDQCNGCVHTERGKRRTRTRVLRCYLHEQDGVLCVVLALPGNLKLFESIFDQKPKKNLFGLIQMSWLPNFFQPKS